MKQEAKLE
jgi:hypothetical protein